MASKRLVLIDGSAMIFRAFFAIPGNFTTKGGLHTNAIYGFALMFNKLLATRTPDFGAVVFDAPGKTFRDEMYPAYKSHRPRMAGELAEQLPYIDRLVEMHRFPILRVPGYEADDVIGTLTKGAVATGYEVQIISGDKDFAQLISERVKMIDPMRETTYDVELVRKKWGVRPEAFVDLLALVGDKSDNIPGVPGIGQKGAAQLLERFGSLDEIMANVDSLKGRQKANLIEYEDDARLSYALATIDTEVPLSVDVDGLLYTPPDQSDRNALYRELEFFSLLGDDEHAEEPGDSQYIAVSDVETLRARLEDLDVARPVALAPLFDGSVVGAGWVGLAVAVEVGRGFYAPIDDATWPLWCAFLEGPQPKVAHNLKTIFMLAAQRGAALQGAAFDTMLASFLIDPAGLIPHRLEQVTKAFLHRTVRTEKSLRGSGKTTKAFHDVSVEDAAAYGCHLADTILQLHPLLADGVQRAGQAAQLFERDLPLSWVLARMELRGIRVDGDSLSSMGVEFRGRLSKIESEIYEMAGRTFNVASTKQLGQVLFEELNLPVVKRTKTGYSTNIEVLERLAPKHPIAQRLIEQRKLSKLINTYTDVLEKAVHEQTGRIHATFQQAVGVTGRLITTDPDLQRTPVRTEEGRRIREAFVAEQGYTLISADWSQIELRVLAHMSRDPGLVEAFLGGLDVHRRTAAELFCCSEADVTAQQRGVGKTINFATIYGQGATALGQILGIAKKEAEQYIHRYFETYEGVRRWRDETIGHAHLDGFVETLSGRRRYIAEIKSNAFMTRQAGERIAVNTPIQGTAADICKAAMLSIDAALKAEALDARMLLQVHDELVFEVASELLDPVATLVRHHMETAVELSVPLVVDLGSGKSWAAAH